MLRPENNAGHQKLLELRFALSIHLGSDNAERKLPLSSAHACPDLFVFFPFLEELYTYDLRRHPPARVYIFSEATLIVLVSTKSRPGSPKLPRIVAGLRYCTNLNSEQRRFYQTHSALVS